MVWSAHPPLDQRKQVQKVGFDYMCQAYMIAEETCRGVGNLMYHLGHGSKQPSSKKLIPPAAELVTLSLR